MYSFKVISKMRPQVRMLVFASMISLLALALVLLSNSGRDNTPTGGPIVINPPSDGGTIPSNGGTTDPGTSDGDVEKPSHCSDGWVCSDWGGCENGKQTRECKCGCQQTADCGPKPDEERDCECGNYGDCPKKECQSVKCADYRCEYSPESGTECDDGNPCTGGDRCENGTCVSGGFICECRTTGDCPPNECKAASCRNDKCEYINVGGGCDDGNDCTENDTCVDGECKGDNVCECESGSECDDNDDRTEDRCVKNVCVNIPIEEKEEENETAQTEAEEVVTYEKKNISVSIDVTPEQEEYLPGAEIKRITVIVSENGEPVEGASVMGRIDGNQRSGANLSFTAAGDGAYYSDTSYGILSREKRLLPILVRVTIENNTINETKYLRVSSQASFTLRINKPLDNANVAPGQDVTFEAEILKAAVSDKLDLENVSVIDERTGEVFGMEPKGRVYSRDITIPKNVYDSAYFLVLAKAIVNGNESDNYQRIELIRKPKLYIDFESSKRDVKTGVFALEIRYVNEDGPIIKDSVVSTKITSYPSGSEQQVELAKDGDFYIGIYKRKKGDERAEIELQDAYGNKGDTELPQDFFEEVGEFKIPWDSIVIVAITGVGAAAGFSLIRYLLGRKRYKSMQVKMLSAQKVELENLIERTKLQFYKRQVSQEVANKQISEYEERLKLVEQKLGDKERKG